MKNWEVERSWMWEDTRVKNVHWETIVMVHKKDGRSLNPDNEKNQESDMWGWRKICVSRDTVIVLSVKD